MSNIVSSNQPRSSDPENEDGILILSENARSRFYVLATGFRDYIDYIYVDMEFKIVQNVIAQISNLYMN